MYLLINHLSLFIILLLDEINYSPYYIERVVTRDGDVHVIRKDAKTEFECSRQGYFRHPSGCNRFYRCVKFDQQSNYFTVYEYDCPDGLAFDEKVEVCVWPGSLSDTRACQGKHIKSHFKNILELMNYKFIFD